MPVAMIAAIYASCGISVGGVFRLRGLTLFLTVLIFADLSHGDEMVSPSGQALITKFGAIGDGEKLNTKFIQEAIDRSAVAGGGTVVIPPGNFLSGALFFKSGVKLHLEKGAVLRCSPNMKDFPVQRTRIEGHFEEAFTPALINVNGCDGFRMSGEGTLDGAGRPIWDQFWKSLKANPKFKNLDLPRARLALIENSRDVVIEGITFKDSQFWNLHLYRCRNVLIKDVRFLVPDDYKHAPSTDGIDVDSSQDVTIRRCLFSVTDDCIAMKGSKGPDAMDDQDSPPVERVRISDCEFRRGNGIITCGSEATVVRDVVAENSRVSGEMPLLNLKLRGDTPQRYEKIVIRGVIVASDSVRVFSIDKWSQYFDLKGKPEPESLVNDIVISGVRGRVGTLGVIRGNEKTRFGRILIEDVDVQAKNGKLIIDRRANPKIKNVRVNGSSLELQEKPRRDLKMR